ncbi:MAG: precorrin-6A reductase [Clostridia bacterium]|nr:precorrin-6A reductase [Clostridia bacterium]
MILLLAGTGDGRMIAGMLKDEGYQVLATTVSGYGQELLRQDYQDMMVLSGSLGAGDLAMLICSNGIKIVVDATHPYAVNVSKMAMEVCRHLQVSYIRYERETTLLGGADKNILLVDSFTQAAARAKEYSGNIFLTLGSHNLAAFCAVIPVERLVARVLPVSAAIGKCEALGLKPGNIIAIQGPFSAELNKQLFKEFKAGVVVTKDSGKTGGVQEKITAARKLALPVIIVRRPILAYPVMVHDFAELLRELGKRNS